MNIIEINKAYNLANSNKELKEDLSIFHGCYFQSKLIYCTIEQAAQFLRQEAKNSDNTWDFKELDNCKRLMKLRFKLIGEPTLDLSELIRFNVVDGFLMQRPNGQAVYFNDVVELLQKIGYRVL